MKKLLIVDDDLAFSFQLERLFKDSYDIDKSVDGMGALGKINDQLYDCIILDIDILGGVDGYEVLKGIKGQSKTKRIPVIVLTNAGYEKKDSFMKMGADEYFVKGETSMEDLESVVAKWINSPVRTSEED